MFNNQSPVFAMSFMGFSGASLPAWLNDIIASSFVQQMSGYMPHFLLAMALGACIGIERRHKQKIAGIRTHMLVCISSCMITLMGVFIVRQAGVGDATRIAGQILPALGFIGMGVITRKGWTTSGVTTAATILFTAGVGIMVGYSYFSPATTVSILTIIALQLSYWLFPSTDAGGHAVKVICPIDYFHETRKLFGERAKLDRISKSNGNVEFRLITQLTGDEIDDLLAQQVHNPHLITIELDEHDDK